MSATTSVTPTGVEDYLVKPCRYLAVRDVARFFPVPFTGLKWIQQQGPDPGECHWVVNGSSNNTHWRRDDFGLIITARAPQYGLAPPPSEPDFANVPAQILAQVKAGVRQVHVGGASGWFNPYYQVAGGGRIATHLDLGVGQYNLKIYADTSYFDSQYQSVEDAATAASDLAAAEKIASAVLARLPAKPPAP